MGPSEVRLHSKRRLELAADRDVITLVEPEDPTQIRVPLREGWIELERPLGGGSRSRQRFSSGYVVDVVDVVVGDAEVSDRVAGVSRERLVKVADAVVERRGSRQRDFVTGLQVELIGLQVVSRLLLE